MSKKSYILSFVLCLFWAYPALAQSGSQPSPYLHYADDILRYSLEYPSYDPISLVMPGTSDNTGFGTYQQNPASAALFENSYFSFDLSSRFLNETGSYLGNKKDFSDNQTGIGDLGFVFKIPTVQGSLVIGGGYSQTTDFNRTFSVGGRNNTSTITDFYNSSLASDSLFFAAFDVYAIDFATTDSSYSDTKSIFRFFDNPSDYPGVNQNVEFKERGQMGKYSAFFATEFAKNISVGASIGYLYGDYSLNQNFLESDPGNSEYNSTFIDSDGDGTGDTDIDNILSVNTVDATLQAFSARLGLLYTINRNFNIGASYEFPSKLNISEDYNTKLTTNLDNGVQFADQAPGSYSYKITRPGRIKAGFTYHNDFGLTFSASAEQVSYSKGKIQFDELNLTSDENAINSSVRSNLNDVVNFRGGVSYSINRQFTPRLGYAYYPSPQKNFDSARQFISGGFSAEITRGLLFDFGLQYSFWNDQNTLYRTPTTSAVAGEDVSRINMMLGLRMTL